MRRRYLSLAGGFVLLMAGASFPTAVRAGSPNPITVTPQGGPVPYTGTVNPPQPDPNGPPAPACTPPDGTTGCDDENVTLGSGGLSASQYDFGLVATITYTASDPTGQNAPDVAILDSSRNSLSSAQLVLPGHPISANGLSPGSYIVEVDANGQVEGLTPQSFTMNVKATATPKQPVTGGTSAPVSFSHEVTVDPNRMNGEPDVAIANNGNEMYTSGPWGFSTTVSMAWKSEDAGVQWDLLHGSCPANPLRPFCSRGGGDTEIELGTPATPGGEQPGYYVDLNGLDTLTCAITTNGGRSFNITGGDTVPSNPVGPQGQACNVLNDSTAPSAPGSDRQWIAVWPPVDNGTTHDDYFMVYDTGDTPPGGDDAMMSLDGGQSLTAACRTVAPPTGTTVSCVGGPNGYGSRPGPLVINPVAINTVNTTLGNRWPTLYEFMGTTGTGPEVNISCDGGQSWSHALIDPTSKAGSLTITNDFVVGAIDTAGGLYVAWAQQSFGPGGQWEVRYSHSTDATGTAHQGNCSIPVQGATWSTPINLTGPGSAAPGINFGVMPAIAAGDPGRVDVAYYGSADPASTNPATAATMTWFLHMEQSLNGNSATPAFGDAQASETPMHKHSICFSGLACALPPEGDRNLADFFEVRPDPTGRAVILYVDDNNTQPGPPAPAGFTGASIISSVQQASGPSLYAANPALGRTGDVPALTSGLSQSLDLRNSVTDPSNDALLPAHQPAPGSNVDAADLTGLSATPSGNALDVKFTVKSLAGGPGSAVVNNAATAAAGETHTGAIYLASWHFGDDFWGAWATTDAAGTVSCVAGKPLDVFSSSAPKALQYLQDPQGNQNHAVTGNGCKVSGNTIEIDVPLTDIGSPSGTSVLYGFTGFTADTSNAVTTDGITGSSSPTAIPNGAAGFFDNIDQTAPMDVPFASVPTNVPEAPSLPLVLGLGVLAISGAGLVTRRRRHLSATS